MDTHMTVFFVASATETYAQNARRFEKTYVIRVRSKSRAPHSRSLLDSSKKDTGSMEISLNPGRMFLLHQQMGRSCLPLECEYDCNKASNTGEMNSQRNGSISSDRVNHLFGKSVKTK